MAFCTDCGVEVESRLISCPLCHGPLADSTKGGPAVDQGYPLPRRSVAHETERLLRKRGFALLILSIVLALTVIVCIVLDSLYSANGWSAYVVLGLGLVWTISFMALYFLRTFLSLALPMIGAVQAFVLGLDFLDGNIQWALSLALPIVGWVVAGVFIVWFSLHVFRTRLGFALAGFLAAVALVCFGIDTSISLYQGQSGLLWSIVVVFALIPMAMVALVLQILWLRSERFRRFLQW